MRCIISLLGVVALLSTPFPLSAEPITIPKMNASDTSGLENFPDIMSGRVQLSWEEFKAVLDQIKTPDKPVKKDPPPPIDWSLNSVEYTSEAAEFGRVRVDARMAITVLHPESWVVIPVMHESVAPISIKLDGETTALTRMDDGWHALMLKGAGTHTFESTFYVSQMKSEGKSSFNFPTPRTPMTTMALRIPMNDARVSAPEAARIHPTAGEDFLDVDLAFTGTEKIQIEWVSPTLLSQQPTAIDALAACSINTMAQLSETHIGLVSQLNYKVLRGSLDRFTVALPLDANVYNVNGQKGLEWQRREQDGVQLIDVLLNHKVDSALTFTIEYEAKLEPDTQSFTIPELEVRDVLRSSGYIAVAANSNVELKPGIDLTNLSRVDVAGLPAPLTNLAKKPVALGFRYNTGEYVLPLDMVVTEARVASNTGTLVTITDTHLSVESNLRFDVLRGAVKSFRFSLPENVNVSSIDGIGIVPSVETVEGQQIHTVSLDREVFDAYQFSIRYEIPLPDNMALLQIPELEVLDTIRSRGDIAITVAGNMEINEAGDAINVRRVDEFELPAIIRGRTQTPILFAYHHDTRGYQLGFSAKKLKDVAVQVAVIDQARLTTLITNQKQVTTLAQYAVRNNERQFLRVVLGDSAEVLGARVAGRPAKPSVDESGEGKAILLPLRKTGPDGSSFMVELIYVEENPDPKRDRVNFGLVAPSVDMKIDEMNWDVRIPDSEHAYKFTTELERINDEFDFTFGFNYPLYDEHGYTDAFVGVQNVGTKNQVVPTYFHKQDGGRFLANDVDAFFSDDPTALIELDSHEKEALESLGYAGNSFTEQRTTISVAKRKPNAAKVAGVMPLNIKIPEKGMLYTFNRLYIPKNTPLALSVNIGKKSIWQKKSFGLSVAGPILGFILMRTFRNTKERKPRLIVGGSTFVLLTAAIMWNAVPYFASSLVIGAIPYLLHVYRERRHANRPEPSAPLIPATEG